MPPEAGAVKCEARWARNSKDHRAGDRCGAAARFYLRFGQLFMAVCPYHRDRVLLEVTRKRVDVRVIAIEREKRWKGDVGTCRASAKTGELPRG